MTTTDRPTSDVQGATREQWDELFAAAHRLDVFCRTIDALRGNDNSDVPQEINYMERAAWSESHHIAELIAALPSPYDDTTRED